MSTLVHSPQNSHEHFRKESSLNRTFNSSVLNVANLSIDQLSVNQFLEELGVVGHGSKIIYSDQKLLDHISKLNETLSSRYKIGEHFESSEKYGQGSFGGVFKIYDTKFKKIYAKKIITANIPHFKAVILNELISIKHITDINNPELVQIYKVNYFPNDKFEIIMEAGYDTLKDFFRFIEKKKYVYSDMYQDIHNQLWEQLKIFHDNHICHRDIKPSNIIWTEGNKFKLVDFGCSQKFLKRGPQRVSVVGTREFMNPELLKSVKSNETHCITDPFQADEFALNKTLDQFLKLTEKFSFNIKKEDLANEFKEDVEYNLYKRIESIKKKEMVIPSLIKMEKFEAAENLIKREIGDLENMEGGFPAKRIEALGRQRLRIDKLKSSVLEDVRTLYQE